MKIDKKDLLTIPNAMSVGGAVAAIHGAQHLDTWAGLAETVAGRLADLGDGWVARHFNQGSELGAAIDATADKLAGLAIVVSEYRKDIAPKPALVAIVAQNVANAGATALAAKKYPDEELKPTKEGKLAMASQNLALGAYATANLLKDKHETSAKIMRGLGHAATIIGVGYFGTKATSQYISRARG